MKQIEVHIKEKDKGAKDLSLFNLKDEIVNFLYKDTVANSTRSDLQFYILLFFASVSNNNKTLLEEIFDEAIPKLKELNQAFSNKKGRLRAGEYKELVDSHGLAEIFERDVFFVLAQAVLNIQEIEDRFGDYYSKNEELQQVMELVKTNYAAELEASFTNFKSSRIEDDRYDEYGNYHDLSKSVYRTVRMRTSRSLDVNLQKYTSIKQITSQSPIDLTFIQHIDPQIIIDLWDKYQLAYYMKPLWAFANSPIGSGVIGGLVVKYVDFRKNKEKPDKKDKDAAKANFEIAKVGANKELEDLTIRLTDSVLDTKVRLEKEVDRLNADLRKQQDKADRDEQEIKKLKERIDQLENIDVTVELQEE